MVEVGLKVLMTETERHLYECFVNCSKRYLEFGSGGSTCIAASRPKEWLITVDSSEEWLKNVAMATDQYPTKPETVFVDIGPLREFGAPADISTRPRWPSYHEQIWLRPECSNADLYFVDGRFRVACVLQCLLRGRPNTPIIVHDFSSRPQYHVIRSFAHEIAIAGDLSIFVRSDTFEVGAALHTLKEYRLNPG
jgi:hypothetical protein